MGLWQGSSAAVAILIRGASGSLIYAAGRLRTHCSVPCAELTATWMRLNATLPRSGNFVSGALGHYGLLDQLSYFLQGSRSSFKILRPGNKGYKHLLWLTFFMRKIRQQTADKMGTSSGGFCFLFLVIPSLQSLPALWWKTCFRRCRPTS